MPSVTLASLLERLSFSEGPLAFGASLAFFLIDFGLLDFTFFSFCTFSPLYGHFVEAFFLRLSATHRGLQSAWIDKSNALEPDAVNLDFLNGGFLFSH